MVWRLLQTEGNTTKPFVSFAKKAFWPISTACELDKASNKIAN